MGSFAANSGSNVTESADGTDDDLEIEGEVRFHASDVFASNLNSSCLMQC